MKVPNRRKRKEQLKERGKEMAGILKRDNSIGKGKKERPPSKKKKGFFQWFVNIKIFGKIFILAIILLLFLAAMGLYSLYAMTELNKNAENIYKEQMTRIRLLAEIRHYMALNSLSVTEHTTTIDPVRLQLIDTEIQGNKETMDQLIEEFKSMAQDENELGLIESLETVLAEYRGEVREILEISRARQKMTQMKTEWLSP